MRNRLKTWLWQIYIFIKGYQDLIRRKMSIPRSDFGCPPLTNIEKYKQVLHYIVHNAGGMKNVGKTVIYKMIYFSDFDHYEQHENSITGETYRKIGKGPAPCHFRDISKILKKEKKIRVDRLPYWGRKQHKYTSLKEPSTDLISESELTTIKTAIQKLLTKNASKASTYSHEDIPWIATNNKKIINYNLVFYRTPEFATKTYPDEVT